MADLKAEVARLRKALKPFADHAFALEQPHARATPEPDDTVVHWSQEGMSAGPRALRLGHFRAARAALKES